MVGAARRLATELVVIMARATQEMYWLVFARVRAAGIDAALSAGTSAALMAIPFACEACSDHLRLARSRVRLVSRSVGSNASGTWRPAAGSPLAGDTV